MIVNKTFMVGIKKMMKKLLSQTFYQSYIFYFLFIHLFHSFLCMFVCTGQDPIINTAYPCEIKCEEIIDPQCHLVSYTYAGFPNLLGHPKQGYIQQYDHLIEILEKRCFEDATEFLCGILTPHCIEGEGLILPSKAKCKEFHEACDEFLEEAGSPAGSFLASCDDLPDEENAAPVCIHYPTKAPGPMPTFAATESAKCQGKYQFDLLHNLI